MDSILNWEKQEQARSIIEEYCKDWKIFIDTCSLLHFAAESFFVNIIPLLNKYNNKIIIPIRCIEEVEKHSKNENDVELAQKAQSCIKKINQLLEAGYVDIRGEKTDNFADNVFQVVFTKFRMNHKLLLITQDNNLAKDILALNENKSVKANEVKVKRINKYGFLSEFYWKDSQEAAEEKKKQRNNRVELVEDELFRVCSEVTTISDDKIKVSEFPTAGSSVYTYKGSIKLIKELGKGGEATVYLTNTPYIAKIYMKDNITVRKYKKIQLMLSKKIECEGICYPVEILYNSKHEFIGYLMPKAEGKELQRTLFQPIPFIKSNPNWKKRDSVELCVTILEKIKYLHDRNIILGDINPANILFVSPKEVYFVDTDSYQVEDFPCPVGMVNYTAPEIIQLKGFSDCLRTKGNEYFAVATLLFMIMLPGKPPYSQQGGEDPKSNILKMDFSYPFGDSSNKKTPDGPWRYMWSHLPYDIKEAFYNTFRKDGAYSKEGTRLSVDEWLPKFRYYLELLDSGKYAQQDAMSIELLPTRHKKNPNSTYIKCKLCKQDADEKNCKNGICVACLEKGEVYRCKKCGKELIFTNYYKYVKGIKKRDICEVCFEQGKKVRVRDYCVECGRSFELTNSQYDFYIEKGYDLPRRCEFCRKNKSSRGNSAYRYSPRSYDSNTWSSSYYDYVSTRPASTPISTYQMPTKPTYQKPTKTSSSVYDDILSQYSFEQYISSKSTDENTSSRRKYTADDFGTMCFITTAVCEGLGKKDDCYELMTLRNYRDTWLANSEGGQELIKEYYRIAPLIVSRMKTSERYFEYCVFLLENYINPCIDMIEKKEYEKCREKYKQMVTIAETLI